MVADTELEAQTTQLQLDIQKWLTDRGLWYDCGYSTFSQVYGEYAKPWPDPVVFTLWFEGPFYNVYHGYTGNWDIRNEFDRFINTTGFWYDCKDHVTLVFMPTEHHELFAAYKQLYDFKWLCHAILPNYVDLDAELYAHFASHPDDLTRIPHRDFEVLLDSIFRNHGYRTVLGPGSNDRGVDIRLYHDDNIGELTTLVQAKRYAQHRPINLEAVAALKAVVDDENANRGLFVTTSRFLPSAKRFAQRQSQRLVLADSADIQSWCTTVSEQIEVPKRVDLNELANSRRDGSLIGKVFHGHSHGGHNEFCVVVRDTPETVFVRPLKKREAEARPPQSSGGFWIGPQIPKIQNGVAETDGEFLVARLDRKDGCALSFWAGSTRYTEWNGKPMQDEVDPYR